MFTKWLSSNIRLNLLILILFFALTFPAYKDLLKGGMISGHDTEGHLVRLIEFDTALKDGHFPVRWSKRLNFGLGYPFFNFDYPGTYYLTDLIYHLRGSFVNSIKIVFLLSFPLSGFFTFLWLKNHFNKTSSLIGGLFYSLVPYHFLNIYVRGALAEVIALSLIPLNFYLIDRIILKKTWLNAAFFALSFSLLTISHNLTALIFLIIFLVYGTSMILLRKDKESLFMFLVSLGWGVAISAFFVIPALIYKKDTVLETSLTKYYIQNFPSFQSLIYSPWGFGTSKAGPGEMSFQVGLLHQLILLLGTFFVILGIKIKKVRRILPIFALVLAIVAVYLMQDISLPLWGKIKTLQYMEFPWRFLGVLAISSAIMSAFVFSLIPKKVYWLIVPLGIAALLFLNRSYWHVNKYYTWYDYWSQDGYFGTTTIAAEQSPKWQFPDEQFLPHIPYRKISGDFNINNPIWNTNLHRFQISASKESVILDRTDYFPGWTVFIDGKQSSILDYNSPAAKGLIGFSVPSGNHNVDVKLLETPLEKISDFVSAAAILAVLIVGGLRWRKK